MVQSVKPGDLGVAIGTVFLGKYRVDSILGHGGMGIVAECMHLALNERRAVKMLRQDVLMDQDAVSRFLREAQAAVKLKSEYVAKVHDVGAFENGVPYMEMEFLEGHDLGELLKQRGVLPAQWAAELMLQTCDALAEAHSLGIVHRDVKPTNLFVTWRPDGSALIKVLDFGISKSPMGTDMHLTQTQSLLGTPAYMSPEQMRSARLVDSRTDIWSLGTVMYEVLEGRKPFEAESFSEMCVKVAVDPPAPMVNTPPPMQQVILKCLAKAPEQRYPNMGELARDLVPFCPDPRSAQVMVERMGRMLRRSGIDFSGNTSSSSDIPRAVRDLPSAPVRVLTPPGQWSVGSDPSASPWAGQSQPMMTPFPGTPLETVKEGSQPFPTIKRRRWPFVLLGFAIAGAAATGVVLAMNGGGDETPAQTQPAEPKLEVMTAAPTAPPAPAAPVETKSADKIEAPAATPPPALPVADTKPSEPKKLPTGAHAGKATSKAPTSAGKHDEAKPREPRETKESKEAGAAKTAAPLPPCDPFDDSHGDKCKHGN